MSEEVERGQHAEKLLQDPLIVAALDGIEQTLQDSWNDASTTQVREELWYTMKGMQRFKQYLMVAIEQGEYETILTEKENATS